MEGKRTAPGRTKEGYVRVCCELPKSVNDVFLQFQERTNKKINKSKIMIKALTEEAEKIKAEGF